MFPVNSAERAPAARGIRRKIIKILLLVEWCFIGENSKEGITSLCGGRGGYEERDNKRESRSIDCAD